MASDKNKDRANRLFDKIGFPPNRDHFRRKIYIDGKLVFDYIVSKEKAEKEKSMDLIDIMNSFFTEQSQYLKLNDWADYRRFHEFDSFESVILDDTSAIFIETQSNK